MLYLASIGLAVAAVTIAAVCMAFADPGGEV